VNVQRNIREREYVQYPGNILVLIRSQHLLQHWPVVHGLITQAETEERRGRQDWEE